MRCEVLYDLIVHLGIIFSSMHFCRKKLLFLYERCDNVSFVFSQLFKKNVWLSIPTVGRPEMVLNQTNFQFSTTDMETYD